MQPGLATTGPGHRDRIVEGGDCLHKWGSDSGGALCSQGILHGARSHGKFLIRGVASSGLSFWIMFCWKLPCHISSTQTDWVNRKWTWLYLPCLVAMETEYHHSWWACFPLVLCDYCCSLPYVVPWDWGNFFSLLCLNCLEFPHPLFFNFKSLCSQSSSTVGQFTKVKIRQPWKCLKEMRLLPKGKRLPGLRQRGSQEEA